MEPRIGRVVNGAIVLDDGDDLVEGDAVTVWIGDPNQPVSVGPQESDLIRQGQAAASRSELLDARAFLEELRRGG